MPVEVGSPRAAVMSSPSDVTSSSAATAVARLPLPSPEPCVAVAIAPAERDVRERGEVVQREPLTGEPSASSP